MPIANMLTSDIGGRAGLPEGPFGTIGNYPMPSFEFGETIDGNRGSVFIYCRYAPVGSGTWNQGDVFVFDVESFTAHPATLGSAYNPFGAWVGTLYLGNKSGVDASLAPSTWSWTYTAGTYGIWLQIAGCGLVNANSINAQTKPCSTTATAGQVDFPSSAAANSQTVALLYPPLLTGTFTANTTNGSQTLTNVSSNKNLFPGMTLSGTGIPNGTYIVDMQGSTMTISNAATATNSSQTITWKNQTFWGTTVNGSPIITVTSALPGIYPNQTLTGTGVSGTVSSINGNPGNWTITLSANASASGTVSIAATGYYEAVLDYPYISAQN